MTGTITLLRIDANPELLAADLQGDDLLLVQHDIGNLNNDYKLKVSSLLRVLSDGVGSEVRGEVTESMESFHEDMEDYIAEARQALSSDISTARTQMQQDVSAAISGMQDTLSSSLAQMRQDLPGALVLTDADFARIF